MGEKFAQRELGLTVEGPGEWRRLNSGEALPAADEIRRVARLLREKHAQFAAVPGFEGFGEKEPGDFYFQELARCAIVALGEKEDG